MERYMDEQIDSELKAVVAEMEAEVQSRVEARKLILDQRVRDINENKPDGPEVGIGIDVDVTMKDVELIFDLPSITMRDHRIVFGLPEITMRDQDIIFHTPSIRMVTRKVGQYPEFHGFTVRWRDILIDVPEPFMQEQRIVMGVPEFAMRDHEFILGLPEFTMVRNRIVLSLPQITIRNVDVVVADMRRDAQAAKEETETGIRSDLKEVGTASQTRIVASVSKIFEGARTKLIEQREQAFIVFDGLIRSLQGTIGDLRARNATADTIATIEGSLQKATADRQGATDRFEEQLAGLNAQEQDVVHMMLERLSFSLPEPGAAAAVQRLPIALAKRPLGTLMAFPRRGVVREMRPRPIAGEKAA
jgi:hypothetical protein